MKSSPVKVLLYDVETSPNLAFCWGKYEQNVLGDFIKERQIISFAWKWLDEKEVHCLALPMFPSYKKKPDDNKALILRLHELISRADVVVGHNVNCFDDQMANTDFILHGLKPPPPHKSVDTLAVARAKFRFNSNKLGDLGKRLGLGEKVHTGGFELWAGCLRGDKKSWAKMVEYNKGDVVLLEKIYLKMRPWMTAHPNMNSADNHVGCPVCRSTKLTRRGWVIVAGGRRMRFQCMNCGKWVSGKIVKNEWKFS